MTLVPSLDADISADAMLRTLSMTEVVDGLRWIERLGEARAYKVSSYHDRRLRDLLGRFEGREVEKTDSFLLLFERPVDAVAHAVAYQDAIVELSAELGIELEARVAIHLGEVLVRENAPADVARGANPLEVTGLARSITARLLKLGRPRQILLTRGAYEFARQAVDQKQAVELRWATHGPYLFQGLSEPLEVFEVSREGRATLRPPPDSSQARRAAVQPRPSSEQAARSARNPFYHRQAIRDARYFFGRAETVRSLLEMVASGQSCAVLGERRIGKSSLLAHLTDRRVLLAHGHEPARTLMATMDFLALGSCTADELWTEMAEALEEAVAEETDAELRDHLREVAGRAELAFGDLRRALRRLRHGGIRVAFLCDELELAVRNPHFDESLFGALRSLAGEGVVFVTASRLSLLELEQYKSEEVRRKILGSPFFNIFAEFRLGPFEDHEVAELLATLLEPTPLRFNRDDVAFLTRIAGRHPYFIQLAAYHLYRTLGRARRTLSAEEVLASRADLHTEVHAHVEREAIKVFRNQLQYSTAVERRVLLQLAHAAADAEPFRPGEADLRTLERLERRGLVCSDRRRLDASRSTGRGMPRRWRLFSEILEYWIRAAVTPPTSTAEDGTAPIVTVSPVLHLGAPGDPTLPERYSVLEEIGRGGTGTVYKAWDEHLERVVALKVLHRDLGSPDALENLLVEARTCARLHHPNIVVVHDIDMEHAYLVQELLAGGSLRDLLEQRPVLSAGEVIRLARQLAGALGVAHREGIVHRDVKPENILLTAPAPLHGDASRFPDVKLSDFGTALRLDDPRQLGERRGIAGTLAYMAPEQIAGEEVGPAVDFFALGVVLYETLHGERPPPDGTPDQLQERPGGTTELDRIVASCLESSPRHRLRSAERLQSDLEKIEPTER